jgi:glutathione peroxidase-family protein
VFSFVPTKKNVEEKCAERVNKYSKNKTKIEELSIWNFTPFCVDEGNIVRKFRNVYLRRHFNTSDR